MWVRIWGCIGKIQECCLHKYLSPLSPGDWKSWAQCIHDFPADVICTFKAGWSFVQCNPMPYPPAKKASLCWAADDQPCYSCWQSGKQEYILETIVWILLGILRWRSLNICGLWTLCIFCICQHHGLHTTKHVRRGWRRLHKTAQRLPDLLGCSWANSQDFYMASAMWSSVICMKVHFAEQNDEVAKWCQLS